MRTAASGSDTSDGDAANEHFVRGRMSGGSTVLVVDDEAEIVEDIVEHLEHLGYATCSASSGAEALTRLSEHPEIRVCLTDIRMPEMDGIDLLNRMRLVDTRRFMQMHWIMLTGHATATDEKAAFAAGAGTFLRKPCSLSQITAAVAQAFVAVGGGLHGGDRGRGPIPEDIAHISPDAGDSGKTKSMKHVIASVMLLLAGWNSALAELAAPQGRVILEVAGQIGVGNAENAEGKPVARFDLGGLTRLPQTTIETTTEWTKGVQVFEGILLRDLLKVVDASGDNIRVLALNDYEATIPVGDADAYDVLLALRHNGEFMPVRDKGPIWIIYPLKEQDAHLMSTINAKMVWQLSKLFVE